MYKIDFDKPLTVHFIGIGGISMSGLAEVLLKQNFRVSGSDIASTSITGHLKDLGATVFLGHSGSNITKELELVVYTAAIKPDNVEFLSVQAHSIPMIDRAELLGQIMSNYPHSIGVAGTHGKTTTTSMMSQLLLDADKDPTVSVGGMLDILGGNIRVGDSSYFITEACEYANSFLKFYPSVAIVLNVEADHLDFFKDLEDIRRSFRRYLENVPENGTIIINSDIIDYETLVEGLKCKVITYGSSENHPDYTAKNISFNKFGCATFDLYLKGQKLESIAINSTGTHNIYNAIAAIAAAGAMGIEAATIKNSFVNFVGPKRRFEYKGSLKGVTIIDDYAHHPTEIEATLKAAKKIDHHALWVVFQPHTYSRTKSFLNEFAKALSIADHIILADIYAAREKDLGEIHAKDLLLKLQPLNEQCHYFSSFDEIEIFILENCIPDDVLITMGAGNIHLIGEDLLLG
ncbi:MAG: UDP-N-acetylmuramate--L-alanine ligase [Vallitaleaceae bacterium]|nr:UDP-N-acetylmuramate--L-alanine ligase [Vallitaleaceae bacterium]